MNRIRLCLLFFCFSSILIVQPSYSSFSIKDRLQDTVKKKSNLLDTLLIDTVETTKELATAKQVYEEKKKEYQNINKDADTKKIFS